jgi:hypothetical protein
MKRRLFNLAAAVSLGMMLSTVALWVRSYWRHDSFERDFPLRTVESERGVLSYLKMREWRNGTPVPYGLQSADTSICGWSLRATNAVFRRGRSDFMGFRYSRRIPFTSANSRLLMDYVSVPHWMPVILLSVLPADWYRRKRREGQRNAEARPDLCLHCGYDLRATPERCPECGTAVAPKPAEAAA